MEKEKLVLQERVVVGVFELVGQNFKRFIVALHDGLNKVFR